MTELNQWIGKKVRTEDFTIAPCGALRNMCEHEECQDESNPFGAEGTVESVVLSEDGVHYWLNFDWGYSIMALDTTVVRAVDERIVYGAQCSWWGSIYDVGASGSELPGCPHCHGVLFEVASEEEWWKGIDQYIARTGDQNYRKFTEWLKGKCFRSVQVAMEHYRNRETK